MLEFHSLLRSFLSYARADGLTRASTRSIRWLYWNSPIHRLAIHNWLGRRKVSRTRKRESNTQEVRRVDGGRLIYYKATADADYWDEHWRRNLSSATYRWAEMGHLGPFEVPFTRFLPRTGRILEAGCGLGTIVLALNVRGYNVEGIEWGKKTVDAVYAHRRDLAVRLGDVLHLDVPDAYYEGYISLGVVEHRRRGPEPFLEEAYRVLKPGGMLLISVPQFHLLRRLKAQFGLSRKSSHGLHFYQYAFKPRNFVGIVKGVGFQVLESYGYDPLKGLRDEVQVIEFLLRQPVVGGVLERAISSWSVAQKYLGHMFLVAAQKP